MKVMIIGTLPSSLWNFRGELIKSIVGNGHSVLAMASDATEEEVSKIKRLGCEYRDYFVERSSLNPVGDLKSARQLYSAMKDYKPDIVLAYTIKPIIWGGIVSRFFPKVRFNALVTGLGFVFHGTTLRRKIIRWLVTCLYRQALKKAENVLFQNRDNQNEFRKRKLIPDTAGTEVVNGSGVDIKNHEFSTLPEGNLRFLVIARLLGEKGLREYAEAASLVKAQHPEIQFDLLGPWDPSPDGISMEEVSGWQAINYLGSAGDVRPYIRNCHVYCLPSYHEGLPRTVIEAMAHGRPILTTTAPGCKETVIEGENGYKVEPQSSIALTKAMLTMINNKTQLAHMGLCSRRLAEEHYDVTKVNRVIMSKLLLTA